MTTPRTDDSDLTPVQALQRALAAEHAAVYLFGLLGARTSAGADPTLFDRLTESYSRHRGNRDQLELIVARHGADPVAAAVAYEPPGPVDTTAQIQAAALSIERRVTLTYGSVVEGTARADRRWAIGQLTASALRELGYGGTPERLPGS